MFAQGPVLVVDDEPDVAGLLVALLESEGYRTFQASSGTEALDLVARKRPRAVVLDLSLPDLDGVQVLRKIKSSKESAAIPVIVVSAYTGRLEKTDRALTDAVFEKPFDLDDLSRTMGRLLERRQKAAGAVAAHPRSIPPPALPIA